MTRTYLKDLAERAVKTFAQALVAVLSAGSMDLLSVPWTAALSTAGLAALLSVLTSVASAGFGDLNSASLVAQSQNSKEDGDKATEKRP